MDLYNIHIPRSIHLYEFINKIDFFRLGRSVVSDSTVTLLEMRHMFFKLLNLSYKIHLWQVIVSTVAIVLMLHSLYISDKLKPHLQAKQDLGCIGDFTKALKWMELPSKMENLNENPVYAKFNISRKEKPPKFNLLIIVSSAPKRYDRRLATRETWWQQCKSTKRVSGHLFLHPGLLERGVGAT